MDATKVIGKAAVTGGVSAGVAMAATAADLLPDVIWPSNAPAIMSEQSNAQFFGVAGAVGSLGADILKETVIDSVFRGAAGDITRMAAGPAIAAGSAYAFISLVDSNALVSPIVTPAQILGLVAVGELLGDRVAGMIPFLN